MGSFFVPFKKEKYYFHNIFIILSQQDLGGKLLMVVI